ncbi:antibiotic biosynthesis monooxygenase [Actinobacteria bacterium YIM 96077]|uniref:Antibiotic biosynthesis monooxygenase n=1 Tax=Phytoactinopolyspora halophila TaxID=1981511 RepID=A0A329QAE8_9ACTN|nr:putative quinol monooxygenase [Phytoactinopolyspora halophila]AYY13713.1 antibiotic biosynthesis monooxygenase [Actinobacteria bacterium YIM 96077]RAW09355.1 antibiotic biosynthesis monooxygenase [Phytoactinopolyspora halophila]
MPFVVAAIWKAKPGEEKRVEDVIRTMTPLSRAEEKNLYYQAHVSPDDPRTFFLYEQYVDQAGYEEHKASPHFQEHVFGYIINYLEHREVATYETIDV